MSDEREEFSYDDGALEKIGTSLDLILNGAVRSEDRANGWVLLIWPFHSPAIAAYPSNGERTSMIEALEETAARLKAKQESEE